MTTNFYNFDHTNRCLISPALGCDASCFYCYCNVIKKKKFFTSEEILEKVTSDKRYIKGQTIISLGCYTECLTPDTLHTTLQLINFFLQEGHKVSIATKQDSMLLKSIDENKNNLFVFISCPTISSWSALERGTLHPLKRLDRIPELKALQIIPVIYIKPFLSATYNEIDTFIDICDKYKTDVVVGRSFSPNGAGKEVQLSNDKFYEDLDEQYDFFIEKLRTVTNVYQNSIDILDK